MKFVIALLFWVLTRGTLAQTNTNTWFLLQPSFKTNQWLHTLELGHRRMDDFIVHPRQYLTRYTVTYSVKKFSFGGGIALFDHYRQAVERWEPEGRIFTQLGYQSKKMESLFRLRFRYEIRKFDWNPMAFNRVRLQCQWTTNHFFEKLKFQLGNELFYTFNAPKHWENRSSCGILIGIPKNVSLSLLYIYQNQQESKLRNIHIFQFGLLKEFDFSKK